MNVTQLRDAASILNLFTVSLPGQLERVRKESVAEACVSYHDLRNAYEALDESRKLVYEALEGLARGALVEMLEEHEVTTLTVEVNTSTKYRFTKTQRVSCSMPDKEGGIDWLKTADDGKHKAIVQETVNSGTLSAFAKSYMKDTGKELPSDYFKLSTLTLVSMTKA